MPLNEMQTLYGGKYNGTIVKISKGIPVYRATYVMYADAVTMDTDIAHLGEGVKIKLCLCTYERTWVGEIVTKESRDDLMRYAKDIAVAFYSRNIERALSTMQVEVDMEPFNKIPRSTLRCHANTFIYLHKSPCECESL